jgi:hypothetical protein
MEKFRKKCFMKSSWNSKRVGTQKKVLYEEFIEQQKSRNPEKSAV